MWWDASELDARVAAKSVPTQFKGPQRVRVSNDVGPPSPLPTTLSFAPLPPRFPAMAIQKEPGQKGINWSNMAVGQSRYLS
jgi:hypothetical protein